MNLTLFQQCADGNHTACPVAYPAPPGQYGGSRCTCSCHLPKPHLLISLPCLDTEKELIRAERDRLRALAGELARALEQDREIFQHYSELHAAKNTEVARQKAAANAEYAATIRRLLARPEVKELLEVAL